MGGNGVADFGRCPANRMHYFESQLVSTVRAVEETDGEVVFVGHYRHGDGASLPGFAVAIAAVLLIFLGSGPWPLSIAVLPLVVALAMAIYRKTITFHRDTTSVEVATRTLFGTRTTVYPVASAKLQTQRIHIRLAENCGAVDLRLPDQAIRLSVDGRFERSLAVAQKLSDLAGIEILAGE